MNVGDPDTKIREHPHTRTWPINGLPEISAVTIKIGEVIALGSPRLLRAGWPVLTPVLLFPGAFLSVSDRNCCTDRFRSASGEAVAGIDAGIFRLHDSPPHVNIGRECYLGVCKYFRVGISTGVRAHAKNQYSGRSEDQRNNSGKLQLKDENALYYFRCESVTIKVLAS